MTQTLVQVVNRVDTTAIRKEKNGRGDDVYVVPSFTLPDNCVMNGGYYPAEEIAKSYLTLEGAPAPIGHPFNDNGDYVSAVSDDGLNYFYAGATNKNVRRVADDKYGHRVYIEKHINIKTAMATERGQRLIEAIEAGEPIHTSTGLLVEPIQSEGTNAKGEAYTWIATEMSFDHDAVLLDEEGAATPEDGVGMMINHKLMTQVNHNGVMMAVNTVKPEPIEKQLNELTADGDQKSLLEAVINAAKSLLTRGNATTQPNQEDGEMAYKERIESALKANKVDIDGLTDEQKLDAYEKLMKGNAAQETDGDPEPSKGEPVLNEQVQTLVDNAVAKALKANKAEQEKAERDALAETLTANKVELSREEQGQMSVNALKVLADNSKPVGNSYGVPGYQVNAQSEENALANFPE